MGLRTFVSLVVLVLIAIAASGVFATTLQDTAAGSPDPISGEWNVSFKLQATSTPATFKLKLDGKRVTGTAESDHTGPGTLSDGSWVDNKLKFTLDFARHESIAVTGYLHDGKLIGEFSTEGIQGTWEAKKNTAPVEKSVGGAFASHSMQTGT